MNLSTLIKQYFPSKSEDITIDVFDEKNIYTVYQRVVGVLTQYIEIETTNKEINPAEVVANRTDVATQYNEAFLNDNELEELW